MQPIRKILVPTDLSTDSHAALDEAIAMAQLCEASLTLLYVEEPPLVAHGDPTFGYALDVYCQMEERAHEGLGRLAGEVEGKCSYPVFTKAVTGSPPQAIVDEARDGNYDLIVLSTHGRTGLAHFFNGSIAERVVQLAPCRVLTLHRPSSSANAV